MALPAWTARSLFISGRCLHSLIAWRNGMSRSLFRFVLIFIICLVLFFTVTITRTIPSGHAKQGASSLSVSVGYAEDKNQSSLSPATFPIPWAGSPNTIFLGNPVYGSSQCGTLPQCYDAGSIRLDNRG